MSLSAYKFLLECDHEGCKNRLVASHARAMEEAGWQVVKVGYEDRDWVDLCDKTYCPQHGAEGRKVFSILVPEPGTPRGRPIGEAAVALLKQLDERGI